MAQKWPGNGPEMAQEWPRNGPEMVRKWPGNGPENGYKTPSVSDTDLIARYDIVFHVTNRKQCVENIQRVVELSKLGGGVTSDFYDGSITKNAILKNENFFEPKLLPISITNCSALCRSLDLKSW